MRYYLLCLCISISFCLCITRLAQADAPIVDLNDFPEETAGSSTPSIPSIEGAPVIAKTEQDTTLSLEQRVVLLEKQVNNFMQINLPGKIDALEQQIHQLNGQLEEQSHLFKKIQEGNPRSDEMLSSPQSIQPSVKQANLNKLSHEIPVQAKNPNHLEAVQKQTSASTDLIEQNVLNKTSDRIATAETALVRNAPLPFEKK